MKSRRGGYKERRGEILVKEGKKVKRAIHEERKKGDGKL